jgi:hypothetical protein
MLYNEQVFYQKGEVMPNKFGNIIRLRNVIGDRALDVVVQMVKKDIAMH